MNRILLSLCLIISVAASAQRVTQPATKQISVNNPTISTSVINPNWVEKEPAVNGFSRVLQHGKFSFVDNTGKLITPVQFEDTRNFEHKLAAVKKDSRWGFIDQAGKVVIGFQYDIVYDFKEVVTPAFDGKTWFLIDVENNRVKTLDIDICFGFDNGYAKLRKGTRTGTMNLKGEITYTGTVVSPRRSPAPVPNNSVTDCPNNIDFENGNFSNWNCFTGFADSVGATNVINVVPSAAIPNRHRLINRVLPSAIDAYGLFDTNPPDGSNYAVKLGNTRIGGEAERIQYVIRIPANDSNFSIRYDYAVVFQDPGHTAWTQPRFTAKLFDSAANHYVDCASFEYISTSGLPGFERSTVDTSVIYKSWASAFISLRAHAGQTLYLEFTTADCVRKGHWGYAYVDVESACSHAIDINYSCETGIADLSGPPGFEEYNWWNQDYSAILATGQHVVLNPAPMVNSTVWLEMIPFSDFGCKDTMPAHLTGSFSPHFDISEQNAICAPHSFTFYNRDLPSASVSWNFGDGNTGFGDTVIHIFTTPGTFVVTMHVILPGGCEGSFSDTVRISQPTGIFDYSGGNYCQAQDVLFTAVSAADSISWHFGDGNSVTTDNLSVFYTYSSPGIYVPSFTLISNHGCEVTLPGPDTIRIENLAANFNFIQQRNCGSTLVNFTNSSQSFFGSSQLSWNFGDGGTATGNNPGHTYTASGNYLVQLIVTGVTGCRDTITKPVSILVNNLPAASITGPVSACLHSGVVFQSSIQSQDPINTLSWSASDGSSGTGSTFTVNFAQAGSYTVQLIAGTIHGCFDTTTQQVTIKQTPEMVQPSNLQLCSGSDVAEIIFAGSAANTLYTWTNNLPSIGLAANGNGNIQSFTAENNSNDAVTATITVSATANGCPAENNIFTITVLAPPGIAQPADQVLCNRGVTDAVTLNSFTGQAANANYSWTNSQSGIGLPTIGTGNIPSFTAINNGILPITATITISGSDGGCPAIPQSFNITINPTPEVAAPANQSVCGRTTTNSLHFTGTIGSSSYNWTNDQIMIGLGASGVDSVGSFTAINNTASVILSNITVTPVAFGCSGTPATFSIAVNPIPDVNQPADQSLCTGRPTTAVSFTGSVNGTMYNWTNDMPSIGLPANGTGNLLSFNPNNSSNANVTAIISVTPVANGCEGAPKTFSLTIFPTPGVIQPLNQFQCNGEMSIPITFISPVSGTTYSWTNSLPSLGLPASGTGNVPSFSTVNNTNSSITATITVTPSTNDCPGISKTFYITVDPTPVIAQPGSYRVCRGETIAATSFTGTVTGTTYTWINSASNIGLAPSGAGNIPSFISTNNTPFPITAIIQVTGSANSCGSVIKVFTITVEPTPMVDPTADQVVCNATRYAGIALTGPGSGTNYSWRNDKPSIGLPGTGSGNIPAFMAVNTTTAPVVATVIVFGSSNGCSVAIDTFTLTVNPPPFIQVNDSMSVCQGSTVQMTASGAAVYTWSPATGLSCVSCADPAVTPANSTSYLVTGTSSLGCTSQDSVMLLVRKPFDMLTPVNDTICAGRSVNLYASNAASYAWWPATGLNNANIASPIATPTATTQYRVVGYDTYHCFTDTGYVTIAVAPQPLVNIGPDITSTTGAPMTFNPVIQNGPVVHYTWTPANELSCSDCATPTTTIKNNMMYSLRVENSFGCSAVDSIFVTAFCQKSEVFVPNAFTPDGDGLNDILMIRGTGIMVKSFRVFNRWGNMIFEKQNFAANDPKFGWDGRVRGVPANPDVYVYTAEVVCDSGAVYTYKGNTTILK